MCRKVECRLACAVDSVREARAVVGAALEEAGVVAGERTGDLRDDVLLVTSELLTNAVRAGRRTVSLDLEMHRSWLGVAVSDDSPAPAVRRRPGPDEVHGRGVDMIATLSSEWGQTTWNGSSKTVWSRIRLPADRHLGIDCSFG